NFLGDEKSIWIDYGSDNYAGVTWNNTSDNLKFRKFIGWMSNWKYGQLVPTSKWRSAMTIPRNVTLIKESDRYRLKFSSINLQKLESTSYKETVSNQLNLEESLNRILLSEISTDSFEINFKNNKENLSIKFSSGIFEIDRSNFQTETGFDDNKRTLELGTFRKRFINKQTANFKSKVSSLEILLDNSSIEIFVNEGSLVMSDVFFYNSRFNVIEFSGLDDSLIEHQVLESIW
ncbi:MAG: GH32 C-terminal domain-containing protein, partial [Flavobacteriaceae bacterium]